MSSCFGFRKPPADEREPLLPQYQDETVLQRELHQKLHSYQMLRALSKGFMPSNEQLIINLRTILSLDLLNPNNPELSDSGRLLVKYTKQWLQQFMQLLQHKNSEDQIQDFIWFLSKSRISVDVEHLSQRATKAKAKADTAAGMNATFTYPAIIFFFSKVACSDMPVIITFRLPLTQCSTSTSMPRISFRPIHFKGIN